MTTILGKKPEQNEELNKQQGQVGAVIEGYSKEITMEKALIISALVHFLIWFILMVLTILGINFPFMVKEPPKPKDIEFIIVNKPEKPPINKNTKLRSDRNSQAGGKHDPTRNQSDPEPAAAPSKPQKPSPPPAPKQTAPKPPTQAPKPRTVAPKVPPRPMPNPTPTTPPKVKTPDPFSIPVPKAKIPDNITPFTGGPVTTGPIAPSTQSSTPAPMMSSSSSNSIRSSSGYSMGNPGNIGNPSPGNPNGSPGVDALKEPDFGPYMMELQRRIKRKWNPPRGNESKRVVLLFKVSKDGRLLALKVYKTSTVPEADQAAIQAVKEAAPFRPLPVEYQGDDIDIQFTFDYNVFGIGGRKF